MQLLKEGITKYIKKQAHGRSLLFSWAITAAHCQSCHTVRKLNWYKLRKCAVAGPVPRGHFSLPTTGLWVNSWPLWRYKSCKHSMSMRTSFGWRELGVETGIAYLDQRDENLYFFLKNLIPPQMCTVTISRRYQIHFLHFCPFSQVHSH